ncbi:MAG: efflux RND transporter periplasmic adaptor subunit [Anaerolineales bacterium]
MQKDCRVRLIVTVLVLGGLILVGCDRKQPPPPVIPEVAIVTVSPERVVLTTELPGRTYAYLVAEIRPQVGGIIQKRLFEEGSDVRAGSVLYQIDPAPYQAAYSNAVAALSKSEANLPPVRLKAERYKELIAKKAISQQDFDNAEAALRQAEADIESAKATVESARINLAYTRITAPISGRIGKSNVTVGALVTAGGPTQQPTALATIQQLDPIYVDVSQSTNELLRLRRRMEEGRLHHNGKDQSKVRLILDDGTTYPLEGTLKFRDVTVDSTTGAVTLRVVVPNPKDLLLPGMFLRAVVQEGVNKDGILIPQQAVSRDPMGNPVTLIVDGDGKVAQRMLTLDRAIGNRWLVTSGLAPGERVIVEGIQKVRPGATVKVVASQAGRTSSAAKEAAQPAPKSN